MSISRVREKSALKSSGFKKFIDFDKQEHIFFDNLYLEELKLVIKLPLVSGKERKAKVPEIKVEKFNLTKYTFLTSY